MTSPAHDRDDLLTFAEAADELGVSLRTIQRCVADDMIPVITVTTGIKQTRPRLRRADLNKLKESK